ncbi:hypothetical protein DPMN_041488 [Dreissena polymorpha]|uniref:Uncharacterized protein n=1 Tax=Dreissena polymorpha TaxID=45954 RepID=A0A9D4CX08_DREPO|nr:hypothetical protein DPMN_041488 [Dreissena polymorpha]
MMRVICLEIWAYNDHLCRAYLHATGGCWPFKSNKCCEISTVYMPLHNLCLDSNVPLIEELVGNVMEPEVMNNTPVHRAAYDKRQQLIKLFHKIC